MYTGISYTVVALGGHEFINFFRFTIEVIFCSTVENDRF